MTGRRRSPQVKELGAVIYNCSCLAEDLGKIFEAYWALGVPGATIPVPWPANYSTAFNRETPLELQLNGTDAAVYFSVRPLPAAAGFPCTEGGLRRRQPLPGAPPAELPAGLLRRRPHPGPGGAAGRHRHGRGLRGRGGDELPAHHRVLPPAEVRPLPRPPQRASTGAASPRACVCPPPARFWPAIDTRLRAAVFERRVRVRLLAGCWHHSKADMFPFLKSLAALADNRTRYGVEVVGTTRRRRRCRWCRGGTGAVTVSWLPTAAVPGASQRGASPDPLRPRQPRQVHGDGEGGLHR